MVYDHPPEPFYSTYWRDDVYGHLGHVFRIKRDSKVNDEDVPTPMAINAAQMHEFFVAFVAAGFSEDQALRLLAYTIANKRDE